MRGFVISAPSSGQGKTVITLGLLRALRDRGVRIASAKSGPDYIDPAFHEVATGRASVTLDAWSAGAGQLAARAAMLAEEAELMVVEGAMGLFDGGISDGPIGRGATAEVARALGWPVVLVIDASGMGQTAGAVAAGLAKVSPDVRVAGVILNRVASQRHGAMLKAGLAPVCPVVGEIPKDAALGLPSRHLGLVQACETAGLEDQIGRIAQIVAAHCDLDRLAALAAPMPRAGPPMRMPPLGQRIAVARDDAFSFTYWHQVEDWRAAGAEILPFSPLADQGPDAGADAVFLPGGYPELHAGQLASAKGFRAAMARAAERGAVIYGECGGYMVLGETLVDAEGAAHPMLGLLRLTTSFQQRKRHLGYRRVTGGGPLTGTFGAHEFHYASTLAEEGAPLFAEVTDASGAPLGDMGLREGAVMGSFAHLIERQV
ncbi:cobyrinate a,c-diamide synthase [Rhodobacteraceae bacterium NNCM2]|nr:cobyrinate a,c-diamide synthase [Coraliihabitans acroporae]